MGPRGTSIACCCFPLMHSSLTILPLFFKSTKQVPSLGLCTCFSLSPIHTSTGLASLPHQSPFHKVLLRIALFRGATCWPLQSLPLCLSCCVLFHIDCFPNIYLQSLHWNANSKRAGLICVTTSEPGTVWCARVRVRDEQFGGGMVELRGVAAVER